MSATQPPQDPHLHTRRMPERSLFYDRVVPLILVSLGIIMALLIVIAAGVLLGLIHYQ